MIVFSELQVSYIYLYSDQRPLRAPALNNRQDIFWKTSSSNILPDQINFQQKQFSYRLFLYDLHGLLVHNIKIRFLKVRCFEMSSC